MPVNKVAENVLGTMGECEAVMTTAKSVVGGTVCWTGQIIPQIWKSWREKSTKGFSPWLMLLWGIASIFMGAYALIQRLNIPLSLQPQLFGLLCLISWGQCQYYEMKRSRRVAILMTLGMIVVCGAIEVVLVLTIRPMQNHHGRDIAVKFFGILSCILISVALFPQYYEIYKFKAVIGISLVFMAIDMLGGLLNDLSLVFAERFDILAALSYTLVIALDGVIVICAAVFKFLAWRRRRRGETTSNGVVTGGGADSEVGQSGAQEALDRELNSTPLQHLTILSRSASRLSQTPSRYEWIVSEDVRKDEGVKSTSKSVEEHLEEGEGNMKGEVAIHERGVERPRSQQQQVEDRIGTVNLPPPSPSPPPLA